ncbi:hypothetical protein TNCV_3946451 [Trichonephila clavipes]|nr:hypothetical protein TNCV_3946451 [Trichonephila clavipes]
MSTKLTGEQNTAGFSDHLTAPQCARTKKTEIATEGLGLLWTAARIINQLYELVLKLFEDNLGIKDAQIRKVSLGLPQTRKHGKRSMGQKGLGASALKREKKPFQVLTQVAKNDVNVAVFVIL